MDPKTTEDYENLRKSLTEMYDHGLYVFGGNHTSMALKYLCKEYASIGKRTPALWTRWPVIIYALRGGFSDDHVLCDIVGELDNEQLAIPISLQDRLKRMRQR